MTGFDADTQNHTVLREIVILTDGGGLDSSEYSAALALARTNDVVVSVLAYGASANQSVNGMMPITWATGGTYGKASSLSTFIQSFRNVLDLGADTDNDGIPDDLEDDLILYNGKTISTDYELADTDEDGLKDGEEVRLEVKYSPDGNYATVVGHLISDPTEMDSEGDGVPDNEDTARLTKGLAGGIVGELSLVSSFDNISNGSGHSFLVYHSYINDSLNVGGLKGGYRVIDNPNGTHNWERVNNPTSDSNYQIRRDHYITFGAITTDTSGAVVNSIFDNISSLFDNRQTQGGVYFNEETNTLLFPNNPKFNDYFPNYCIDHELTDKQIKMLLEFLSENNYYNLLYHNCSTIASAAWNYIVNDNTIARTTLVLPNPIAPFGLMLLSWDSPEYLKNNLYNRPHREFKFNHLKNVFRSELGYG